MDSKDVLKLVAATLTAAKLGSDKAQGSLRSSDDFVNAYRHMFDALCRNEKENKPAGRPAGLSI